MALLIDGTDGRPIIPKKTSVTGRQERLVRLQKGSLFYHYTVLIQKRMPPNSQHSKRHRFLDRKPHRY